MFNNVCNFSTQAWIEHRRHLEGCKVFNGFRRLCLCLSIFHISVATPHPDHKSPTIRRWLSQIQFIPVNYIVLVNAFQCFCFFLWQVKYVSVKLQKYFGFNEHRCDHYSDKKISNKIQYCMTISPWSIPFINDLVPKSVGFICEWWIFLQ